MPDRSKAPAIRGIDRLALPAPERRELANGTPVYVTNMGTQDVLKIELVFFAGRPFEHKKLVSRATAGLLREGTQRRSSAEIAEELDFYGSSLSFPFFLDTSNIVLYSLVKHIDRVLPILADMLSGPVFPESELHNFITRNQQRLQIDLQKPDLVAYRQITEDLFGPDHPYGYNSYPETYDALRRDDLVRHFERHYTSGNCQIFLSGHVGPVVIELVDKHLGQAIRRGPARELVVPAVDFPPQRKHLDHSDTVQTAIRIGRRLFSRHHPDYHGLTVLNTVLGGYFGSRLMANIREERGYTYNIYSSLDTNIRDGYFYIGTEVGNEFVADTLKQIYHELEQLREELIDEEEMEMVRNYLLGSYLTNLDGPFNVSDLVKGLVTESLPLSFFAEEVETVRSIRPADLRELARRYLREEDLSEVVVGNVARQ